MTAPAKILVFFPHNPYPPRSGAHQRCLEVLGALRDDGCEVTLLSSTLSTDRPWDAASAAWIEGQGLGRVRLYRPPAWDLRYRQLVARLYRLANRQSRVKAPVPVDSPWFTPPGMRCWFAEIVAETGPDAVLVNYVYWDGLLAAHRPAPFLAVIDAHDLVSLNTQMRLAVLPHLPRPLRAGAVASEVLREDFYARLGLAPSPREFAVYDRYDVTLAITPAEAAAIAAHTTKTRVVLAPMTQDVCALDNRYAGAALFAAGSGAFNGQGYLYFVERVLPRIRAAAPDFALDITGGICADIAPESVAGVNLRGFVPDLAAAYAGARFVVCPVFGGTGQQVKVVEAMAHGLAVIALRGAAEGSPIRDGVNGLIVDAAAAFAEAAITLWRDRALCKRLGTAARDTIAAEFPRSRLRDTLAPLLERGVVGSARDAVP